MFGRFVCGSAAMAKTVPVRYARDKRPAFMGYWAGRFRSPYRFLKVGRLHNYVKDSVKHDILD